MLPTRTIALWVSFFLQKLQLRCYLVCDSCCLDFCGFSNLIVGIMEFFLSSFYVALRFVVFLISGLYTLQKRNLNPRNFSSLCFLVALVVWSSFSFSSFHWYRWLVPFFEFWGWNVSRFCAFGVNFDCATDLKGNFWWICWNAAVFVWQCSLKMRSDVILRHNKS